MKLKNKRIISLLLAMVMLCGMLPMTVLAEEEHTHTYENGICTGCGWARSLSRDIIYGEEPHAHTYTTSVTPPTCTEQGYTTYTCECGDSYVDDYVDDTGHSYEKGICVGCGAKEPQLVPLSCSITPIRGEFNNDTGALLDSSIYGCVIGYKLKKGHTLFINNTDYVFAVRKLFDGNYNTLVRSASSATFTATEDMTVAIRIRKPDQSALTDAELASIVLYDTQFSMKDVPGYSHRFTVEAETIEGGTSTTRAAIFLPESYTDSGTLTRLIIMTNGRNGYLNDCVWNANKVDDVGVMRHYMENGYAVLVVDNTAGTVNGAPDWGNPQLVDSYWKAYEYVQANLNVEKCFSIHSRSMGTFAAMRMMREHPELVKCALMCGAVLSLQSRFSNDPAFLAQRYGFDDATGGTWEADKVVGYDPYTDVDGLEYDLPPTFWMLAEADATGAHLTTIEKIENHGNDVTRKIYTETDHSGVCRLNIQECRDDALAYLEAHQENDAPHRYCAWTITKEANCGENGEMRRECADCNHYETLEIPMLYEHVIVEGETCCAICGNSFIVTREKVTLLPGHFNDKDGSWTSSDIYGHIVNYELKAGHTLSISDENYVFAVRVLNNGSYSTLLKAATADSFTADEDMIVAVRVRKPDMSPMTEEELISVVLYDTFYEEHTHNYTPVVTEPTCTKQGYTTYTCECGDSYVADYVEARGYDWMLEDGEFNLLLIGNSFSEDASSCGQGMQESQLLNILQAMLGEDVKVTVGLCYSGGKGLNWHATQSEQGNRSYSLRVISSEGGKWKSMGSYTSANALGWTDWDVVTLQHYELNTSTGEESNSYPEQVDPKFHKLKAAAEFMLDHVDRYAPDAEVYFYTHWSRASASKLNDGLAAYNQRAAFIPEVLEYAGPETAQRFETIIPVGLSIQNARTTYLALLAYNTTAYADKNLNLYTDAQIGLQRDGGHLSFNIGRYIAGLTFAETIIPEELRADGYVLPDIRITESVGRLPKEYTVIAQKAVKAAVDSWKNGSLAVTTIEGYETDPTVDAGKTLQSSVLEIACAANAEALTAEISRAVLEILPDDFAVDAVSVPEGALAGESFTCDVTIRFGYTSLTVAVNCKAAEHTYENGICTGCGEAEPGYHLPGDINGDGSVNNKDFTRLFQYLADWEVEVVEAALDVNGDGSVNNKDLTRLFQYLSDWDVELK